MATGDQSLVADHIYPIQPVTPIVYSVATLPYPIDVTLVGLEPNTTDIQAAIVAALNDIFLAVGEPGGIVWPSDLYESILAGADALIPAAASQAPAGYLPVLGSFSAPPVASCRIRTRRQNTRQKTT